MNAPPKSIHQEVFDLLAKGKAGEADCKAQEALLSVPYDALLFALRAEAHNNMGKHDDAINLARRALALNPYERRALAVVGTALCMQRHFEAAKAALDHALHLGQDLPQVRWMRSFANLAMFNFEEGFADYDFGFMAGSRALRCPPHKAWNGGKTDVLFIYGEQGLGDHIMYSRFIKLAKERCGGKVVLETRFELIGLFETMVDMVYAIQGDGAIPTQYTAHVSLLSLPHVLGVTSITGEPYIAPQEFDWDLQGARVGFVWSGNPDHSMDSGRSMTVEEAQSFEGLAPFGLLQPYGEIPFEMPRISGPDMAATLAIINKLDLVVSVDTSVAHLAGAMGKECWLIAPKTGEWRWGISGTRSPWYDSIEIFRCPNCEREPALEAVRQRLQERYAGWKESAAAEKKEVEQRLPTIKPGEIPIVEDEAVPNAIRMVSSKQRRKQGKQARTQVLQPVSSLKASAAA